MAERDGRTSRFAAEYGAARRALKAGRELVAVEPGLAAELRSGVAVERAWLRPVVHADPDRPAELPELVVARPGEPPPRLEGWSPLQRQRGGAAR
jgi:hypothetical protein